MIAKKQRIATELCRIAKELLAVDNKRQAKTVTMATIKSILRRIGANTDEYELNRDDVSFWGGSDLYQHDRIEKLAKKLEKALSKAGVAWREVKTGVQIIVYWRDIPEDKGDWNDSSSKWHY